MTWSYWSFLLFLFGHVKEGMPNFDMTFGLIMIGRRIPQSIGYFDGLLGCYLLPNSMGGFALFLQSWFNEFFAYGYLDVTCCLIPWLTLHFLFNLGSMKCLHINISLDGVHIWWVCYWNKRNRIKSLNLILSSLMEIKLRKRKKLKFNQSLRKKITYL